MSRRSRPTFLPTLEAVEKRDLAAAHGPAMLPLWHVGPAHPAHAVPEVHRRPRPERPTAAAAYVSYVAFTLPTTGSQNTLNFLLTREPASGPQPTRQIIYKGQTLAFATADAAGTHSFSVNTYTSTPISPPTTSTTPTRVPNYDFIYVGPGNTFKFVQDPKRPYVSV
jgi:hypothetical protein